jgi:hypothetical protein
MSCSDSQNQETLCFFLFSMSLRDSVKFFPLGRFNSFVREKLRNSLRVVALTTLREVEGEGTDSEALSPRQGWWGMMGMGWNGMEWDGMG